MIESLDQKAARAGRRIEDGFAEPRIGDLDHEAHDSSRRIELAGIACRIAHFAQHRFIKRAERVQFVARREMDARDLVDDVAQQIAALHPVIDAAKHRCDHVAPIVAVGAGELPQVGEEAGPFLAVREARLRLD